MASCSSTGHKLARKDSFTHTLSQATTMMTARAMGLPMYRKFDVPINRKHLTVGDTLERVMIPYALCCSNQHHFDTAFLGTIDPGLLDNPIYCQWCLPNA